MIFPEHLIKPDTSQKGSIEIYLYKEDICYHSKTKYHILQQLEKAYTIVIGQYTSLMIQKLEGVVNFLTVKDEQEMILLLKLINNFTSNSRIKHRFMRIYIRLCSNYLAIPSMQRTIL